MIELLDYFLPSEKQRGILFLVGFQSAIGIVLFAELQGRRQGERPSGSQEKELPLVPSQKRP